MVVAFSEGEALSKTMSHNALLRHTARDSSESFEFIAFCGVNRIVFH